MSQQTLLVSQQMRQRMSTPWHLLHQQGSQPKQLCLMQHRQLLLAWLMTHSTMLMQQAAWHLRSMLCSWNRQRKLQPCQQRQQQQQQQLEG